MTIKRFIEFHVAASLLLAVAAALVAGLAIVNERELATSQRLRMESYRLADELRQSSDDLTRFARTYVVTADPKFEQYYRDVVAIRNGQKPRPEAYDHRIYWDLVADTGRPPRPDTAAVPLKQLMRQAGFTGVELAKLDEALATSDALVKTEDAAMHLVKGEYTDETGTFTKKGRPDQASAIRVMFDPAYLHEKARIMGSIDEFLVMLDERTSSSLEALNDRSASYWRLVQAAVFGLLGLVALPYPLARQRIFAPIAALQRQTQTVTADFDRLANVAGQNARGEPQPFVASSRTIELARRDEIGDLSRAHDQMIGRLQETGAAVATMTAGLRRVNDDVRRRAELGSRDLQQRVHELAGIGTYVIDMKTRTIQASAEAAHLLRMGSETITMPLDEFRRRFYFEADRDASAETAEAAYTAGRSVHLEARVIRGDGEVIWIRSSSNAETNAHGEPVVMGILQDITESKRALLKLREQADIIESVRDVVFSMTPDGLMTSLNPAFERVTGLSAADWLGKPYAALIHPDDVERAAAEFRTALTGTHLANPPLRVRTATGSYRLFDFEVAIRGEDGGVTSVMGIARDVTDREGAQQQLQKSETRFRTLLEHAPVAVSVTRAGSRLYVNQKYRDLYGIGTTDVSKLSVLGGVAPESRELLAERARRRSAGLPEPDEYEVIAQRPDGTRFPMHVAVALLELPDGPAHVAFLTDISEWKKGKEDARN